MYPEIQRPWIAVIPLPRAEPARGLLATTDQFGRFHITCAITPHEGRGTNFVLKLDDRTLPSGFRASTQNLQVQRATRGKALEFNFGASIHRVIGLDLADPVFETTDPRVLANGGSRPAVASAHPAPPRELASRGGGWARLPFSRTEASASSWMQSRK